jgi:hypothetical protein
MLVLQNGLQKLICNKNESFDAESLQDLGLKIQVLSASTPLRSSSLEDPQKSGTPPIYLVACR